MTEEKKEHCESKISETINEVSDFAKKNPEIAKSFFDNLGQGIKLFLISVGTAMGLAAAYFVFK